MHLTLESYEGELGIGLVVLNYSSINTVRNFLFLFFPLVFGLEFRSQLSDLCVNLNPFRNYWSP